jgi:hypothetical protein
MLFANVASADPPAPAPSKAREATALVNKEVVQPLKKSDAKRSKYSRAAPPPKARRVRVTDQVAQVDANGKHFVRFAIDVQHRFAEEGQWQQDAFLGCVYVEEKQVVLEQGSDYRPASDVLDGDGEPEPDACRAAPEDTAEVASAS